jgi:hypothetical protein
MITDLKHLLLCLLIPYYKLLHDPYKVEWAGEMTQGSDYLPLIIVFDELIPSSLQ